MLHFCVLWRDTLLRSNNTPFLLESCGGSVLREAKSDAETLAYPCYDGATFEQWQRDQHLTTLCWVFGEWRNRVGPALYKPFAFGVLGVLAFRSNEYITWFLSSLNQSVSKMHSLLFFQFTHSNSTAVALSARFLRQRTRMKIVTKMEMAITSSTRIPTTPTDTKTPI